MGISDGVNVQHRTGNLEGTALASATRTASTSSPNIINNNARGIIVFLNVTAASGTGGLQVLVQSIDPVSGVGVQHNASPTAITATGVYAYAVYPGASAPGVAGPNLVNQRTAGELARTFRIRVVHGDASSYTYSVGYSLIV